VHSFISEENDVVTISFIFLHQAVRGFILFIFMK
jgi:hypothetical protein